MNTRRIDPVHPGAYIAEMIAEMDFSQARLAQALGVSSMRISHVIRGSRPVTAELALRLGRLFSQSPAYWMGLQSRFDLDTAEDRLSKQVKKDAGRSRLERSVIRRRTATSAARSSEFAKRLRRLLY